MNLKQIFYPSVSMLLLTTACLSLSAPGVEKLPTQTPTIAVSETTPMATPDPTETVTSPEATATWPPEPVASPTATLFPEEQLHTVTDETGAIEAELPTAWTDLRTEPWLDEKGQTLGITFTAATKIEAFLKFQAEGVAISVSRHLKVGYIQLLDAEYKNYLQVCEDTYRTRWTLDYSTYTGKYFVFGKCGGWQDTWLSLFAVTSKQEPGKYVARVVGLDMIPIYGEDFRKIIMQFKVYPEKLP